MLFGALLVTLGILALIAQSGIVPYTSREKVPRNGETQVTVKEEKILSISPVWACLTLAAGATIMVVAARK